MAATAVQLGRAAAQRALPVIKRWMSRAVGGAGGVVEGEEIEKRRTEAENAKSSPLAKAEVDAASRDKCRDCPPLAGHEITKNFKVHEPWMDYQARVTGMRSGPLFLTEWKYEKREFDGFKPAECLLMEAKAAYDQFFSAPGQFEYDFKKRIIWDILIQVKAQHDVALPRPPVQLRWYFMEPWTFEYLQPLIFQISPSIQVIFKP
ncbi:Tox-REase-5 domain-containing protein [Herbaspirillum rubrisubalbicans]|uniref:Tox-REase-5 domain-containing protein n=1 Tax=Herbaspirillum rubrisubalbicans TaxID=80842 RepID=UPI00073A1D32|nr:Tox-REase-5 domain-containing protein [Herbaspirillum rubrisubalbicans]